MNKEKMEETIRQLSQIGQRLSVVSVSGDSVEHLYIARLQLGTLLDNIQKEYQEVAMKIEGESGE